MPAPFIPPQTPGYRRRQADPKQQRPKPKAKAKGHRAQSPKPKAKDTMAPHPPEAPFRYDGALLSSCASSPPVARLLLPAGGGAAPLRRGGASGANAGDCRALFESHAAHYRRPPPSDGERRFWDAFAADGVPPDDDGLDDGDGDDAAGWLRGGGGGPETSPRIEAFLRSVAFVHRHNGAAGTHRVALNGFSDVPPGDLPLMSHAGGGGGDEAASPFFGAGAVADVERLEASLGLHAAEQYLNSFRNRERGMRSKNGGKPMFVPLEDEDTIIKFGEKIRRTRELRRDDRREDADDPSADADAATAAAAAETTGSSLLRSAIDSWWWIGEPPAARRTRPFSTAKGDPASSSDSAGAGAGAGPEEEGGGDDDDGGGGGWDRHLDWATGDNPDGVSVVHDPMNQGLCGSCWVSGGGARPRERGGE